VSREKKNTGNRPGKKKPGRSSPIGPSPEPRTALDEEPGSKARLRLQRAACEEIAEQIEEAGFQAECRSGTVYVWSDSDHIATLSWRKKQGWCLMVRQPATYTRHDLGHAIEEMRRCQAGILAVNKAWERYKKSKTNKNWAEYQGALAAHFFRLYTGGNE